jgi:hypothetical protein
MAQKRMLNKSISISLQVSQLSLKSRLLWTWMIAHADDLGLLPTNARVIKAIVVPLADDFDITDVEKSIEEIKKINLLTEVEYNGQKYLRLDKFFDHQTLKRDRNPQTLLGNITWKQAEKIGFQMEDNGNPKIREEKRSKEKIREDIYANFKFFKNPSFKEAYEGFLEMRKEKKKEPTERAEKMILNKLHTYSLETAIAMLDKSTTNDWTDIYPLKENDFTPPYAKKELPKIEISAEDRKNNLVKLDEMRKKLINKFIS